MSIFRKCLEFLIYTLLMVITTLVGAVIITGLFYMLSYLYISMGDLYGQ